MDSLMKISQGQIEDYISNTTQAALNTKLEVIQVPSITLLTGSWSLVSGLYEYQYSNVNILATSIVDVIPNNASVPIVQIASVLPATESFLGYVKIFATNAPTGDIIVTFNIYN